MSAGPFVIGVYEADYGAGTAVHPIKIQPESGSASIGATPNLPSGLVVATNPISATVSRSQRAPGLNARFITLNNPTAPPTGYTAFSRTKIPALSKAFFVAAQAPGAQCTYLGTTWDVVGTKAEKVR